MSQHRKFDPEFKSHVIMEALTGVKTAAEICRKYNLRSSLFSKWKTQFTHNAGNAFLSVKVVDLAQARIVDLEQMAGRSTESVIIGTYRRIDKDSRELIETQRKLIEGLQRRIK